MAYSAVPTPLYVLYQQRDGFSSFVVTVVFAVYAVGVAASLFFVGHLSDRHGRRPVLVGALVVSAVSAVVFTRVMTVPGLLAGRLLTGLAVGAITATATAWLRELHRRERASTREGHPEAVAAVANLGGIGVGPLVSGALAQWCARPLELPYEAFGVALLTGAAAVALCTETRSRPQPLPPYRPQRVSVPADQRAAYFGAAACAFVSFAALGLFTSMAPTFLLGTLHERSRLLAGVTAFLVFGASAASQVVADRRGSGFELTAGSRAMVGGSSVLALAVWAPAGAGLLPFLLGAVAMGAGSGLLFKGALATVTAVATAERRAEALAGLFLAGYLGLAIPVIGLGSLTLLVAARIALLPFVALLAAGSITALGVVTRSHATA